MTTNTPNGTGNTDRALRVPEDVHAKPAQMRTINAGYVNDILRVVEELKPYKHREPVTIATAIYNTEPHYLEHLCHSIRRQNYTAIDKVYLVDDGSDKESTVKWLKKIERASRRKSKWSKFEVVNRPHRGAAATYNHIFTLPKTEWCALVGSDDIYSYEFISSVMNCINPEIMALGTFCVVIDENNKPIKKWPVTGAPIYNMEIFRTHDVWFDESLKKWIDEEHYQRLNKKLNRDWCYRVLREFLYYYRFHSSNITERMKEREQLKVGNKAFENARVMAVGSLQYESVARQLANVMKATYVSPDGDIDSYNAIYWVGFSDPGLAKLFPQFKAKGKTIVLHWFPSDIEALDYDPKIRRMVVADVDVNLAQDVATKKQLELRGVPSEVLNLRMLDTVDQHLIFKQRFYYLAFGVKQTVAVD